MYYRLKLTAEAYHLPTQKWHVHTTTHGLRAVSRRHALNKGLKIVQSWPAVRDREFHENWKVNCEAEILPDEAKNLTQVRA